MKITNRELELEKERDDAVNAALKLRSELDHISSRNLQLAKELYEFRNEPIMYSPAKLNLLSKRNIELVEENEALKKEKGHHLTGVQAYEMGKKSSTEIEKLRKQLHRQEANFKQLYDDSHNLPEKVKEATNRNLQLMQDNEVLRHDQKLKSLRIVQLVEDASLLDKKDREWRKASADDIRKLIERNAFLTRNTTYTNLNERNASLVKEIAELQKDVDRLADEEAYLKNDLYTAKEDRDGFEEELAVVEDKNKKLNEALRLDPSRREDIRVLEARNKNQAETIGKQDDTIADQVKQIKYLSVPPTTQDTILKMQSEYNTIVLQHAAQVDSIIGLQKHNAAQVKHNVAQEDAIANIITHRDNWKARAKMLQEQAEEDLSERNTNEATIATLRECNNRQAKMVREIGDTRGLKSANDQLREINVDQAAAHQVVLKECVDLKRKNSTQYVTISKFMDRENALKRQNETLREVKDEQAALYTDDLARQSQRLKVSKDQEVKYLRELRDRQSTIIVDLRREREAMSPTTVVMKPVSVKNAKEFIAVTSLKNVYRDRSLKYRRSNEQLRRELDVVKTRLREANDTVKIYEAEKYPQRYSMSARYPVDHSVSTPFVMDDDGGDNPINDTGQEPNDE